MSLDDDLRAATAQLLDAGVNSPRVDAVTLAAFVLGVARGEVVRLSVLGSDFTSEQLQRYDALVAARARRVPLQHLTGVANFRRLALAVGPGVFIPRPETELAVHHVIGWVRGEALVRPIVVDLCTGSGAIALSVADEVADAQVYAVESCPHAYAWAQRNVSDHGDRVTLVHEDATDVRTLAELDGRVDVVVSNPPYIPAGAVPVDPEVRDHDPAVALYGGSADGLSIPLAVARRAATLLRSGGLLVMEHADVQQPALMRALGAAGWVDVRGHDDLAGKPRHVTAHRP